MAQKITFISFLFGRGHSFFFGCIIMLFNCHSNNIFDLNSIIYPWHYFRKYKPIGVERIKQTHKYTQKTNGFAIGQESDNNNNNKNNDSS